MDFYSFLEIIWTEIIISQLIYHDLKAYWTFRFIRKNNKWPCIFFDEDCNYNTKLVTSKEIIAVFQVAFVDQYWRPCAYLFFINVFVLFFILPFFFHFCWRREMINCGLVYSYKCDEKLQNLSNGKNGKKSILFDEKIWHLVKGFYLFMPRRNKKILFLSFAIFETFSRRPF